MAARMLPVLGAFLLLAVACAGPGGGAQPTVEGSPKPGGSLTFGMRADLSASSLDPIKV